MNQLSWTRSTANEELYPLLALLGEDYPLVESPDKGIKLSFSKQESGLNINYNDHKASISYSSLSEAARGIAKLFSKDCSQSWQVSEKSPFNSFGILIDCSRNATLKVDYFKKYLTQLALMGYNLAMLYTKDGYTLPNEDFFGYLRGKYTLEDLHEIDSHASKLGVEMIGSIQALGHLEPTLRWPIYGGIKDTPSVILTSEEKSYDLINKMLDFWSKAFKSRRIHLGMDEAHDLGRGRYMDFNGYKRGYDIFNDHLKRVASSCNQIGLKPIIWSDMYFRMGSKGQDYYDKNLKIPADIKHDIPDTVQLNYWDYYHENEDFYRKWINRHRDDLGFDPVMASGIWSWTSFWNNYETTVNTAVPCIDACIKEGVNDFFFTVWADDGAFYNLESVLAGACSMAEKVFSENHELNEESSRQLFDAICNSDYLIHKTMGGLSTLHLSENGNSNSFNDRAILWDDPLLQIYRKNQCLEIPNWHQNVYDQYSIIYDSVKDASDADSTLYYGKQLVKVMLLKLELLSTLDDGYKNRDTEKLQSLINRIPSLNAAIDELLSRFRTYQYERYNPQGFELLQIRLAGQKERFNEVKLRLEEFISGNVISIPELEEKASCEKVQLAYNKLATASYFV